MKRSGFKQKLYKPLKRSGFTRTKASVRRSRNGIWSTKTADSNFSKFIRERDGKCLRCGTRDNLTCSHFWGRGCSSVRFDPKNCIALCWGPDGCHQYWEDLKNHEYKDFMVEWLGIDDYNALERRARTFKNRRDAVAECKVLIKK